MNGLREQTHEHANRLPTTGGLLKHGEVSEAFAFVQDLADAHVVDRVVFEEGHTTR